MFFPARKLLRSLQPKIPVKKLALVLLTFSILVISFPIAVFSQTTQPPGGYTITTPSGESFQITPLPKPSSDQQVAPIPPGNQANYRVQEALSLGDIGDFFTGLGEGIASFGECLLNLGGCFQATTNNIIEFGVLIIQRLGIRQMGGEKTAKAVDCATLPTAEQLNDPECAQLTTGAGIIEYVANSSPGDFGVLGIGSYTTAVAMQMPLPISSGQYFASINPFKEAHAQGGFGTLQNNTIVLEVWEKVRNASYALAVVVLVIIGFMVMFRMPINPRTVVSAQNSLPRIVLALILITFSFAIAGVMIDLARIASLMIHSFLPSAEAGGLLGLIPFLVSIVIAIGIIIAAGAIIGGGVPGAVVAGAVILLVALLIIIALLVITFMIIFKLISRLVIFLIMTMFAPLFFLGGAFPGGEGMILGWFKRTAAALLSIVGMSFIINLALAVGLSGLGQWDLTFAGGGGSFPALGAGPFLRFFSWGFAAPIIGLVLYSFALKVPEIVDELLDVKPLGARVAGGGAVVIGAVAAPIGLAKGFGQVGRSLQGINTLAGFNLPPGSRIANWAKGLQNIVGGGGGKGAGPCLSLFTTIATPNGSFQIATLKVGMKVWSVSALGERVESVILKVSRTRVTYTHKMVAVLLSTGHEISVTPNHPTFDGREISDLSIGDSYHGVKIVGIKQIVYKEGFTYDILPSGDTGAYWAKGLLLGSTLHHSYKNNSLQDKIRKSLPSSLKATFFRTPPF